MRIRSVLIGLFLIFSITGSITRGQNQGDGVKRIPPVGIEIPAADRAELERGIAELGVEIEALRDRLKKQPALLDLLPDVEIYRNAVRYALIYNEFFKPEEVAVAKSHLRQGLERARLLRDGKAPWTAQTGLVARGYVSQIDGSVQPYGLVVPASYQPGLPHRYRLDVWFHGRNETLSEVNFINDRQKNAGQFTPADAIVLHPYGRYCNANKFAGEVDLFEALESVRGNYAIDENRISVRGFSMGGAATWHIAAHHAGLWASAAPGAGFAETSQYLDVYRKEPVKPAWYEEKLWHLYDATDYAVNFFNLPLVAYSGEIDRQKQAADVMAKALKAEGIELVHIIGPKTEHRYHPDSIREINRRIDGIVARGREEIPRQVKFATWTLRYNRMKWVIVDSLERHWDPARVEAEIVDASTVHVGTKNVSGFTLEMPPGLCPLDRSRKPLAIIDGQKTEAPDVLSDRSWIAHFRKEGSRWIVAAVVDDGEPRKRHGLQGPIDDAFMSAFIFVRPTGKPINEKSGAWVSSELAHAIDHWRRQFRGEARVKDDSAISDEDIANSNLILWGDPASNRILARLTGKLPVVWNAQTVKLKDQEFAAANHVPVMIFPNPLNPKRYIVLNSGFTFREYDYLTNARQVPRLPDWAVFDISVPVSMRAPGKVAAAGFFDELWQLQNRER